MEKPTIQLPDTWLEHLKEEFNQDYMIKLKSKLLELKKNKIIFYPPGKQIFNAFNLTPLDKVKVVILGQDPYHGPGQAHGLSFSVPENIKPPPSLLNIYKELQDDLKKEVNYNNGNFQNPSHIKSLVGIFLQTKLSQLSVMNWKILFSYYGVRLLNQRKR